MRIPKAPERDLAKRVIVEIIRQAGGTLKNKTNLYKAFYHAHLCYADSSPGFLTEWPIVRMPRGPGIHNFDGLLGELLLEGLVHVTTEVVNGYEATVLVLTEDSNKSEPLSECAIEAIKSGVAKVDGKSAAQASHESHASSRAWRNAQDGEELNIYVDLLTDEDLAAKRNKIRRLLALNQES